MWANNSSIAGELFLLSLLISRGNDAAHYIHEGDEFSTGDAPCRMQYPDLLGTAGTSLEYDQALFGNVGPLASKP